MGPLQVVNMVCFGLLLLLCGWVCRVRPTLRPWALTLAVWALNGLAFYLWIWLGGAHENNVIQAWSAMTRLHIIMLVSGGLLITVRNTPNEQRE